jgi:uncharacterized damage-inducible protein DinB
MNEFEMFMDTWDAEARKTVGLLKTLPAHQYDFRPDAGGRSLGELTWHLAELDGYISLMVEKGAIAPGEKPPGIERPRTVAELAPAFERVHREAVDRVKRAVPNGDITRTVTYFDGSPWPVSRVLWSGLLLHQIHHRGQLSLMNRLAGGASPGLMGPNREDTAKRREAAAAKA